MMNTISRLEDDIKAKISTLEKLLDDDNTYESAKNDIKFLEMKLRQLDELNNFYLEW